METIDTAWFPILFQWFKKPKQRIAAQVQGINNDTAESHKYKRSQWFICSQHTHGPTWTITNQHIKNLQQFYSFRNSLKIFVGFYLFITIVWVHTTIDVAWQNRTSTFSFAKKMVRPPTAAGSGISLQNEEVPKTFLKFKQFSWQKKECMYTTIDAAFSIQFQLCLYFYSWVLHGTFSICSLMLHIDLEKKNK